MNYNIDLCFVVPPFINLFFHFFLSSPQQGDISCCPWDLVEYPITWKIALPVLAFFLLFLTVSIKFPLSLSLSVRPIRLQLGDLYFSVLLALTLLGSVLLPMALFCSVYLVCSCIFVASWPRSFVHAFRGWLNSVPAFVVAPDPAGSYSIVEVGRTSVQQLAGEVPTLHGTAVEDLGSEVSSVLGTFDEDLGSEVSTEHENLLVIYGHA